MGRWTQLTEGSGYVYGIGCTDLLPVMILLATYGITYIVCRRDYAYGIGNMNLSAMVFLASVGTLGERRGAGGADVGQ